MGLNRMKLISHQGIEEGLKKDRLGVHHSSNQWIDETDRAGLIELGSLPTLIPLPIAGEMR